MESSLKTNKVIILLGARQVGKTTLLERVLDKYKSLILNFDIEIDKQKFLTASSLSPKEALKMLGNPNILVLDEAQRLPEASRIIKGWYDSRLKTTFILSGSSSLNLLDQSAENLTGRNVKIFLPPLLFKEILNNQDWYKDNLPKNLVIKNFRNQINSLIIEHMSYGSYPESTTTADKESYLLNLTSDYLLKDILNSSLINSPETVKKLLLLLAYQIGSVVSTNELSRNLLVSRQTIDKYLDLLENTYVIFRLPSFSTNLRSEITKSSKIFFWDTGIRNALIKDFSLPPNRTDIGPLWENFIISEFAKINFLNGQKDDLYFWRTKARSEIDLIIRGSNRFDAFEIKWAKNSNFTKSFQNKYHIQPQIINKENFLSIISN